MSYWDSVFFSKRHQSMSRWQKHTCKAQPMTGKRKQESKVKLNKNKVKLHPRKSMRVVNDHSSSME